MVGDNCVSQTAIPLNWPKKHKLKRWNQRDWEIKKDRRRKRDQKLYVMFGKYNQINLIDCVLYLFILLFLFLALSINWLTVCLPGSWCLVAILSCIHKSTECFRLNLFCWFVCWFLFFFILRPLNTHAVVLTFYFNQYNVFSSLWIYVNENAIQFIHLRAAPHYLAIDRHKVTIQQKGKKKNTKTGRNEQILFYLRYISEWCERILKLLCFYFRT